MYTLEQQRKVQQVFVRSMGRFPTQQEIERIYEYDYKGYTWYNSEYAQEQVSFEEYFGGEDTDAWWYEALAATIEDALTPVV